MICRAVGYPDSCALLEINFRGELMYLLFERECVFRICTCEGPCRVYAIISLHFFDALDNRFNDSGGIRSRRVWERRFQGIRTSAHVGVIGIDPRRIPAPHRLKVSVYLPPQASGPQDRRIHEPESLSFFSLQIWRRHAWDYFDDISQRSAACLRPS